MTAAATAEETPRERAEQLKQLRRQIAAVSGKVGGRWRPGEPGDPDPVPSENLLALPEALAAQLPAGLPKGSVAVLSGARSLPVGIAAAVTAAGGHVAILGLPEFGLLAAAEMGADLSRLAVIPDPGTDPVEVAAVLMDGMDLVVLDLAGRSVPLTRARAVVARARQHGCTLLVTRGEWQGAAVRLEARVNGYQITAAGHGGPVPGCGRIGAVRVSVRARGRVLGRAG